MEFIHHAPIPLPLRSLNLGEWVFNLTEEDYRARAVGHHAIGVIGAGQRLGMVNVEAMAGTLLVQHYEARLVQPDHVTFVSPASEGFLLRLLPFKLSVTWDMQATAVNDNTSSLRCTIDVNYPLWVRIAGFFNASSYWVHQHLIEETNGFARDIIAKHTRATARN